jgi:phage terminase Nu1 subunit (DNA packaging protein)
MPGEARRYDLTEIIPWRIKYAEALISPKDTPADPLLDGGDSPALERYRNAKADLAELDIAEREGRLVESDTIKSVLYAVATSIRELGELYQRQGHVAAFDLLQQHLEGIQKRIDEFCDDQGNDAEGGE